MGELTDELEEYGSCFFVEEFVSGGPKNYAFSVFWPSTGIRETKCKLKGITMIYENSKVVNFITLWDMILENAPPVHVNNSRKIKWKHGGLVFQSRTQRSTRLSKRIAGLWTILSSFPMHLRLFIYLFISNKYK